MNVLYLIALVLVFSISAVIPAVADEAVASSSNAAYADGYEDRTSLEFRDYLYDYLNSFIGGPGHEATPSSALAAPEAPEDIAVPGEVIPFNGPELLALASEKNFINVLRFDVTVNGSNYTLLFSPAYIDQLYVDENRRLWNMGTGNVQGLVIDGSFDPYKTTGTLVYLAPCLGNNFSVNHNYGSPNYFRRYYWSSSDRLTYDDTYVRITVDKSYFPFLVSDTLQYALLFLVGGGVLLCWLNRFKRY